MRVEMIGKWKETERRREMQRVELMSWVLRWGRAALLNPFILCPELLHILFQTWAEIYHQGRAGMEDSLQKYRTENAFVVYARQLDKEVMACLFLAELLGRNVCYA